MRLCVFALSAMMLGGCLGTPELPLPSDVKIAEDASESGLVAADGKASETALQKSQSVEEGAASAADKETIADIAPVAANADDGADVEAVPAPAAQTPRRGLRALFGKRDRATNPEPEHAVATVVINEAAAAVDENVAIAPIDTQEAAAPRRQRKGLFGPRRAKTGQFAQVEPDVVLPFGQIGLACGVRGKALGKEVDRFPEHGKGYRLFDTKPSTTGPRTHYITGFKDGCARQFTASLALLGSPVLHEQLLSVGSSQGQHSTNADIAFQKIRAKVCRVGKGKACPEKRVNEMEKSMAFVTTYERFGGNAKWNEILLHNGAVAAH